MASVLINVPKAVRKGDVIEIKTLISHPMETGYRSASDGALIPRDIIHRFVCTFEGVEIFSADLFPAIAANPFIAFTMRAERSGTLTFRWLDDKGGAQVETARLDVQ
jgi:sulfur-oxidizing protein SoxZ